MFNKCNCMRDMNGLLWDKNECLGQEQQHLFHSLLGSWVSVNTICCTCP